MSGFVKALGLGGKFSKWFEGFGGSSDGGMAFGGKSGL